MRQIGFRHQRTLRAPADVRGVGFVTGVRSHVRFLPAAEDTGLVFVRTDLPYRPLTPARPDRVTSTARRTTLGTVETGVTLVEHVLAALSGLRVDNCVIELDAFEPPGLDGSAKGFTEALTAAGVELQSARRPVWAPDEAVVVAHAGATIALHPLDATDMRATYLLDYGPGASIPRQSYTTNVTPETFAGGLADTRTFLLEHESVTLRRMGVGRHLTASELLVFGPRGVIDNQVRYADEPARHKVLDIVGDLALCGFDIAGHVVAYRSGHSLNVALARELVARVEAVCAPPDVIQPAGGFNPTVRRLQPAKAA